MADVPAWVIVAGGFHDRGGMDRANLELADFLLQSGVQVHLVGHEIDDRVGRHPLAVVHAVPRPKGLPALAERLLSGTGRRVAARVTAASPGARVVVNGGNCPWPDVNWVHAVHAAWPVIDDGAPWWSRRRNRRLKEVAVRRERAALRQARLVIANSAATSRAVVERVGVGSERVRTIHLGSDPAWGPASDGERRAARAAFGLPPDSPVVVFVGALGSDLNKGFDVLLPAWARLAASAPADGSSCSARAGRWDARLLVAGGGWRVERWRREAARLGLSSSVHFLGFTTRVREVLAAGDLLVSPVRYEAYGLNVHEALCRGLAVMVTRSAGVVERFEGGMDGAALPEDLAVPALADRLARWRTDVEGWRGRAQRTASRMRQRSWQDMAGEIVATVHRLREQVPA